MKERDDQMTLGDMIVALEGIRDQTTDIVLPMSLLPVGVDSYRGYLDNLAINWYHRDDHKGVAPTVGTLLAQLKTALGKTYQGFKGGNFTMNEDTPVFVAKWGEIGSTCVIGINNQRWCVFIEVGHPLS